MCNKYPVAGVYSLGGSQRLEDLANSVILSGVCLEIEAEQASVVYDESIHDEYEQECDHAYRANLVRETLCPSGRAKHWILETEDGFSLQVIQDSRLEVEYGKLIVLRGKYSTTCQLAEADLAMGDLHKPGVDVRAFCLPPEIHNVVVSDPMGVRVEPTAHYLALFSAQELPL